MKIFTFSGMGFRLSETNPGIKTARFAMAVADAYRDKYSAPRPDYSWAPWKKRGPNKKVRHFSSDINIKSVTLDNPKGFFQLSAMQVLNEEAEARKEKYAQVLYEQTASEPREPLTLISHSQGTNLLTHTLQVLLRDYNDFFSNRVVRCIYLDPKVEVKRARSVYELATPLGARFIYFQSELDLLDNMTAGRRSFFMEDAKADFGDQYWVKHLGHAEIAYWNGSPWNNKAFANDRKEKLTGDPGMNSSLPILTRNRFLKYKQGYYHEARRLPRGATRLTELKERMQKYLTLEPRKPSEMILQFMKGTWRPISDIRPPTKKKTARKRTRRAVKSARSASSRRRRP